MGLLSPFLASVQVCHTSKISFRHLDFLGSSATNMVHYPQRKFCFQVVEIIIQVIVITIYQ